MAVTNLSGFLITYIFIVICLFLIFRNDGKPIMIMIYCLFWPITFCVTLFKALINAIIRNFFNSNWENF